MRIVRSAIARIRTLFSGHDAADLELRAEMEAHLQMEIDEYIRRGIEPKEARRRALMSSAGMTQATESVREQRGIPAVESVIADLRFALRHFRRTPLSTVTMVIVLS